MRSGFGALLNRVAAGILALAKGLLSRVNAFLGGKRTRKRDEIADALREEFDGPYCKLMAEAMSDVTGRLVTPAEMRRMILGDVSLSSRLYHQSRQTGAMVSRIVRDFDLYRGDTRKLALALFEGYGFKDREILNPRVRLPKYMNNAALNRDMDALFARIQAMRIKTDALRASYLQALDAILNGKGQEAIDKALEIAVQERYRYFANRIAQTELARAQNRELAREIMADNWMELVRFRLTDGHVEDICDLFALVDRYGLGPGVYPKALAPLPPLHPHCRCVLHGWAGSAAGAQANPDAIAAFLGGLDERTAARIAGSRTKLDAVLKGADFLDLVNTGRPESYRIGRLGDVD